MVIVIIVLLVKLWAFVLYIVIWSPAGQRHNVTMMIPSLHSAQGVSFHSETSTCTRSHSYLWTFIVHLFFLTNQNWSRIDFVNNNDNGNDIYNDDHINKMEWDFYFQPVSHFCILSVKWNYLTNSHTFPHRCHIIVRDTEVKVAWGFF